MVGGKLPATLAFRKCSNDGSCLLYTNGVPLIPHKDIWYWTLLSHLAGPNWQNMSLKCWKDIPYSFLFGEGYTLFIIIGIGG